jgi:hypothetical protein
VRANPDTRIHYPARHISRHHLHRVTVQRLGPLANLISLFVAILILTDWLIRISNMIDWSIYYSNSDWMVDLPFQLQ